MAMPDLNAELIMRIFKRPHFTVVGPPERLHLDKGRNFESHILAELCKTFKITKFCTTPYHPMGDGLVKQMNRTLLNLLYTYTQGEGDWEEHLQLHLTTTQQNILLQVCHHMKSSLDITLHLYSHQIPAYQR